MEAVKFANQFRKPVRFLSNAGNREKITYSGSYDAQGRFNLEPTGKEDLYGFIQSHAESVDIHVLLKRFANGETDVMQRVQGFYADVSDMPDNFADVLNLVRKGEEFFAGLPADERARYNNSFAEFLAHFDSVSADDRGDLNSKNLDPDPDPGKKGSVPGANDGGKEE